MSRPLDTTRVQMQETFRAFRRPSEASIELSSGNDVSFYPGESAIAPEGRQQLARGLHQRGVYPHPHNLYYCNAEVEVVAYWNSDPSLSNAARRVAENLARRRIQAVFRWFVEHGYDRELLFGRVEPKRPAGAEEGDVSYRIGGGFYPALECEEARQQQRKSATSRRAGLIEIPRQ